MCSEAQSSPCINLDDEEPQPESKRHKNSSDVWECFEKLPAVTGEPPQARCKGCKKLFSCKSTNGTSHLKRHLKNCPKHFARDIKQYYVVQEPSSTGSGSSLTNYKINVEGIHREIGLMVVVDEQPFLMVENIGFRRVMRDACPEFKMMSRQTIKRDIMLIYKKERENLIEALSTCRGRICLTSDTWKSITDDHYICVTAHFVDEEWLLQKRIIHFKLIPPPYDRFCIEDEISSCIAQWNIEHKLFSITLDNVSTNDSVVSMLKNRLNAKKLLPCDGEFFHIRCCAHILNLIVQSGFELISTTIGTLRLAIKYVKQSSHRKRKFYAIAKKLNLDTNKKLILDCPTRWNAIYNMLTVAIRYKSAFVYLGERDNSFIYKLSEDEWGKVEILCNFLKPFYEVTCSFSGVKYPTSNLYFKGVWQIHRKLVDVLKDPANFLTPMVTEMQKKFSKYWSEYSLILSCAVILDPRCKVKFVEFCYTKVYEDDEAEQKTSNVVNTLYKLFEAYKNNSASSSNPSNSGSSVGANTKLRTIDEDDEMKELDAFQGSRYSCQVHKSELDLYLEEPSMNRNSNIDVLEFWRSSKPRLPNLSKMARDILTIPISTVASESTFSTGH